ncbi:MAG TPA: ABC transporter permease [Candidatus Eisenbacteria bacterium]|nr:ABC transporter permease [Candidatus Eisenbacteria bacterium]
MNIVIGILEQGLIYAIMVLGIYITYVILDLPDLTVDGSFPLGAAVCVSLIIAGVHPLLCLFLAFLAGAFAGMITGVIHIKFGVRDLLSGIIVMTGLYTINLFIAGKSNVSIFEAKTIFNNSFINELPISFKRYSILIVVFPILLICKIGLNQYLKSKSGLLLRSTGDNQNLVKTMAKDPGNIKILGLAIANGLVAFSGAILAQQQRFFDVSQGTGIMVMGLASIIIGMRLFKSISKISTATKAIIGSIIYKAIIAVAISFGLPANSLKLITALILLSILFISKKTEERGLANA